MGAFFSMIMARLSASGGDRAVIEQATTADCSCCSTVQYSCEAPPRVDATGDEDVSEGSERTWITLEPRDSLKTRVPI